MPSVPAGLESSCNLSKNHLFCRPGQLQGGRVKYIHYEFKVCKSVHHRTIQINQQPDATIFQFIILTFIYSSTCFGRFPTHHQERNDCSGSLWFYLRIVVTVVLCSWWGRPDHEHSTRYSLLQYVPSAIYGTCKVRKQLKAEI